jgi:hypothetical protein
MDLRPPRPRPWLRGRLREVQRGRPARLAALALHPRDGRRRDRHIRHRAGAYAKVPIGTFPISLEVTPYTPSSRRLRSTFANRHKVSQFPALFTGNRPRREGMNQRYPAVPPECCTCCMLTHTPLHVLHVDTHPLRRNATTMSADTYRPLRRYASAHWESMLTRPEVSGPPGRPARLRLLGAEGAEGPRGRPMRPTRCGRRDAADSRQGRLTLGMLCRLVTAVRLTEAPADEFHLRKQVSFHLRVPTE